jgi:hypothetical protein
MFVENICEKVKKRRLQKPEYEILKAILFIDYNCIILNMQCSYDISKTTANLVESKNQNKSYISNELSPKKRKNQRKIKKKIKPASPKKKITVKKPKAGGDNAEKPRKQYKKRGTKTDYETINDEEAAFILQR